MTTTTVASNNYEATTTGSPSTPVANAVRAVGRFFSREPKVLAAVMTLAVIVAVFRPGGLTCLVLGVAVYAATIGYQLARPYTGRLRPACSAFVAALRQ